MICPETKLKCDKPVTCFDGCFLREEREAEEKKNEQCVSCGCARSAHWIGSDGDDVRNCSNGLTCGCKRPSDRPTPWFRRRTFIEDCFD